MMTKPRRLDDLDQLRSSLGALVEQQQRLNEAKDAPFAQFLTERMLKDLDQCRKLCQRLQQQAAWPSLN
ncbi:MAG TPA: hypothetical protein PKD86_08390 [Gemmatales bacterium]|nr:hypothetical protein [Gemmatales bacterium]HMP59358.1 hypothetical protein [Gemmatales bacterium]